VLHFVLTAHTAATRNNEITLAGGRSNRLVEGVHHANLVIKNIRLVNDMIDIPFNTVDETEK